MLSFRVGANDFATAAEDVTEVLRQPRLTRVPLAPAGVLGLTSLRGRVMPVVSLACALGEKAGQLTLRSRVLVLRLEDPIGVAVDAVGTLSRPGDRAAMQSTPSDGVEGFPGAAQAVRVVDIGDVILREFAGLFRNEPKRAAQETAAEQRAHVPPVEIFISFHLGSQAYALPLADVSEVLAVPRHIATLPGKEAAVLGFAALRDHLLPILSLATLLGLAQGSLDSPSARIVVARIGHTRIGFVVDVARAILRTSPEFIDRVPGILNRGAGEAQIQFIHRLPDGKGMVSILSAERLFRDETVARILADTHQEEHDMEVSSSSRTLERVLAFQLGDEAFGLPIDTVVEVLSLPDKLTRVPHAPDFLQGVMNYRGAMLPIVDQRSRFGLAAARDKAHRRVIVVKVDGIKVGFIVDSVSQILSLRADQVQDAPSLTAGGERLFDRIATLEANGRIVLLIEPRQLLKRAEMDVLASLEKRVGDAAGL